MRCCFSIWTDSSRSTTPLVTLAETPSCSKWRRVCRPAFALPTPCPDWAATSSWFCCPTSRAGERAATAAAKIRACLAMPYRVVDRVIAVTVSIGIAVYPGDGEALGELMKRSDREMYRDKALTRALYAPLAWPRSLRPLEHRRSSSAKNGGKISRAVGSALIQSPHSISCAHACPSACSSAGGPIPS